MFTNLLFLVILTFTIICSPFFERIKHLFLKQHFRQLVKVVPFILGFMLFSTAHAETATTALANSEMKSSSTNHPNDMITITADTAPEFCGFGDGLIEILSTTGGVAPYSYDWSNGATGDFIEDLPAGDYTVTVTDDIGTTAVETFTIETEGEALVLDISSTDALCGNNNGTASVTSNSSSVVNYDWSNGMSGASISNLAPGTYTVTAIDDDFGCEATASVTIGNNNEGLTVTGSSSNSLCTIATGTASASVSGATGAISYLWSNGETTQAIGSLGTGTYSVTATDATGCTGTTSVTVGLTDTNLFVSTTSSDAICMANNGTATAAVVGSLGTFSYLWSNGGSSSTIMNLAPGTYTVTVTNGLGCTGTSSAVVGQTVEDVIIATNSTDAVCDSNNGTASAVANGGRGNFTYQWSNGASGASINSLAPGTYSVTATNTENSCTGTATVTIGQTNTNIPLTASATDATCGLDNGTASVSTTGGTGAISYAWSNGDMGAAISDLPVGTYTVIATDGLGCTGTETVAVALGSSAIAIEVDTAPEFCGLGDGLIEVLNTSGGTPPYTYDWSNGATGDFIEDLTAGDYTVTVTGAGGCSTIETFTIDSEGAAISININSTNALCMANNGTATATISGTTGAVSYDWSNGDSGASIGNLAPGTYTVTAIDEDFGCEATASVTIGQDNIDLTINTSSTDATCDANDGTATASVTGGSGAISYSWSDGQTTATATGLASGTYTVMATDANGCIGNASVTVGQNNVNLAVSTSSTDATCDANDGTATATTTGGSGAISYSWSDGQTTATATGLAPGTYTVVATDANGCIGNASVTVGQNIVSLAVSATSTDETCTAADGTATASTSGGSGAISYAWNNGDTGATITNLSQGIYTVTATDQNGCTGTASVTVGQNIINLEVNISSTDATCDANDGTATTTVTDGTGDISYAWSDGQTTATATGLAPGTYTIVATDENGCTGTASVTVGQNIISLDVNTSTTAANGNANDGTATATVVGGSGAITYTWSNGDTGETISDLAPGTYTVTATDANGCTGTTTAVVDQIDVCDNVTDGGQIGDDEILCIDDNDPANIVSIIDPSGGSGAIEYLWLMNTQTSSPPPASGWVEITGANGPSYDPGQLSETTWFLRCSRRAGCTTYPGESNIIEKSLAGDCSDYCTSQGLDSDYEWIESITVSDLTNTSGNDGGYGDYTSLIANLVQGENASVSLTPGFSDDTYYEKWKIWIDFNQDGDFDDYGETVFSQGSYSTVNGSIWVPSNALTGATRMRISMRYDHSPWACEDFDYGEVEDYTVVISVCDNITDGGDIGEDEVLCPDNNDPAAIVDVISPSGGSGAIEYIWLMNTQTSSPPPANGWVEITGADAASYNPGPISETTWFLRCARRAGCTTYYGESNIVEKSFNGDCSNYCSSQGWDSDYEWIKKIIVGDLTNYSGNDGGYGNYTSLSANLTQGETVDVTLIPGFSWDTYYEKWKIWIDFNQDGDFDDSGETVLYQGSYSAINSSISIPSNALLGTTRMRISMRYNHAPWACEDFDYGEVEDYTVIIGESVECTTVVINHNNFESGWGIWNDGGSDCRRSSDDSYYANSGQYCIRLRDNSSSSVVTTDVLDLSSYEEITIDFSYIAKSMDDYHEDLWLQVSYDGGYTFTTIKEWDYSDEFWNLERMFDAVTIEGPFTSNMVFRFCTDASSDYDWVYLDDITISGCTTVASRAPVGNTPVAAQREEDEQEVTAKVTAVDQIQLAAYPNPVRDLLTIDYQLPMEGEATLVIYDLTGKMVLEQNLSNKDSRKQQTTIAVDHLQNGSYYLRIVGAKQSETVKFVKM